MPRFFFHLHNAMIVHDEVGRDFQTLDEAKAEAVKACRAIMAEDVRNDGQITLSHRIEIHDEEGKVQLILPFRACIEIHS